MGEHDTQASTTGIERATGSALSPMYFPVSPLKLVVMTTCTLGVYEIYWYYKNWSLIRARERLDIWPLGRGLFAQFFCYSLFKRIRATAETYRVQKSVAAGPLATGWIVIGILYRLPEPYWLVTFLAVLFLVPVQAAVNEINLVATPMHDRNRTFTGWNIVVVIIGGLFVALILIGTFLPSASK